MKKKNMLFSTKSYQYVCVFLVCYMIAINNIKNVFLSFVVIIAAFYFIKKSEYLLIPLYLSAIMGEYFVAISGVGISRILTTIFCFIVLLDGFINRQKYQISTIIALFVFSAFFLSSSVFSYRGEYLPALTMILNLLLLFCMYYIKIEDKDIRTYYETLIICVLIFSVYVAFETFGGHGAMQSNRLTFDESTNANMLGMALGQISVIITAAIMYSSRTTLRIVYLFCDLLVLTCLVMTGSRSALIGVIFAVFVVIVLNLFRKGSKCKSIVLIIGVVLMGGLIYNYIMSIDMEILSRFTINSVLETGGTGRTEVWKIVIKDILPKHLWFGVGFGDANVYDIVSRYTMHPHGSHNIFIAIFAQIGVVGGTVFILWLIWILISFCKAFLADNEMMIFPLLMIFQALGNGIGENIWTARYFWFNLGLGFVILHLERSHINMVKNNIKV